MEMADHLVSVGHLTDDTISKARYNLAHSQQYPCENRYYYLGKTMTCFVYY